MPVAKVPESWVWANLRDAVSIRWSAQRHESHSTGPGIPDVSFVMKDADCETGWIELKIVDSLLDDKPNRFKYFTVAQEQWLTEQASLGVPTFLFIAVYDSQEWLWFHGADIGKVQGNTGKGLRELASLKTVGGAAVATYLVEKCRRSRRV